MRLEPTLTKENFWNMMMRKYPLAMRVFCDWIDEYKKEVEWDKLFNGGIYKNPEFEKGSFHSPEITESPKFHDLPGAMQMGIWIEFVRNQGGCSWEIDDMYSYSLDEDIEGYFQLQEFTLKRDQIEKAPQ